MSNFIKITTRAQSSYIARPLQTQGYSRRPYRERDFGVGYGTSSGYASGKRYTTEWTESRFRFA